MQFAAQRDQWLLGEFAGKGVTGRATSDRKTSNGI
jgi:hypothetical protein